MGKPLPVYSKRSVKTDLFSSKYRLNRQEGCGQGALRAVWEEGRHENSNQVQYHQASSWC